MLRESLPLLLALLLPLAGVAGFRPVAGSDTGKAMPVPAGLPSARIATTVYRLPATAIPVLAQPPPVVGVWLNF